MVRILTTGASVAEYEQIIADSLGIVRHQSLLDMSAARDRCHVAQLDLKERPLADLEVVIASNCSSRKPLCCELPVSDVVKQHKQLIQQQITFFLPLSTFRGKKNIRPV